MATWVFSHCTLSRRLCTRVKGAGAVVVDLLSIDLGTSLTQGLKCCGEQSSQWRVDLFG